MLELSDRLQLPLLVPGQGQKDVTHNEALVMLDMLVQPVALSASISTPPESLEAGACWLVPAGATGDWVGHEGAIACWTAGGWRYAVPATGWTIWIIDENIMLRHRDGTWRQETAPGLPVSQPSGGVVVDAEARIAVNLILDRLREAGLIAM